MPSNNDRAQWTQCETCARHVLARDGGCPFCARDAREPAPAIKPAALAIAAIVALAPAASTAELRPAGAGVQRGAQASDAPAYGLAPPRVPAPSAGGVTVENVRVTGGSIAVYRAIIERSQIYGQSCARSTSRTEPVSPDATVTVTVNVPSANARTSPRAVVRAPRLPAAMRSCLESALARLPWTRPTRGTVTARWTLRFRGVDA
ncbi:MAG: hypothetical protein JNK05_16380 [Myxococcales bacterium]|nr:hypothetical protein [Myxococcales bacterium]